MSYPTVLGPWFVVQQYHIDKYEPEHYMTYYQSPEGEEAAPLWTDLKRGAMLFMSLGSAARVAHAIGGEIRVLTTQEEAKEFGR